MSNENSTLSQNKAGNVFLLIEYLVKYIWRKGRK
jgi:hypothetical protein